jgi:hypothetical protein
MKKSILMTLLAVVAAGSVYAVGGGKVDNGNQSPQAPTPPQRTS